MNVESFKRYFIKGNLTIDTFYIVSPERGNKAIGIILPGTGTASGKQKQYKKAVLSIESFLCPVTHNSMLQSASVKQFKIAGRRLLVMLFNVLIPIKSFKAM